MHIILLHNVLFLLNKRTDTVLKLLVKKHVYRISSYYLGKNLRID